MSDLTDRQSVIAALNILGAAMIRTGDLESADALLNRAQKLIQVSRFSTPVEHESSRGSNDTGMRRMHAITLNNSACLHHRLGNYDAALRCIEDALKLNADIRDQARTSRLAGNSSLPSGYIGPNPAAMLLNLSTILSMLGRWHEAERRAKEAVSCVWSFETHWQSPHERMFTAVVSYYNLALAQRALGLHEAAGLSLSLSLSATVHFFGGQGSVSERVRPCSESRIRVQGFGFSSSPLRGHDLRDNTVP
jgi:tetratricopeptide (TPR) repeat protein